jgi:malate dehydrogenase (oxaloacetate-decarboxylating)(NADP+)
LFSQNIDPRHAGFAKDMEPLKDLVQIVKEVKPHAIIGTSTASGAFTEQVVREMAFLNDRPIIFPLSNPTSKAECTAEQAYKWTNVSFMILEYLIFNLTLGNCFIRVWKSI